VLAFVRGFGQEAGSNFFNWLVGLLGEREDSGPDVPEEVRSREDYFLEQYDGSIIFFTMTMKEAPF
jgi:hypothetical protein